MGIHKLDILRSWLSKQRVGLICFHNARWNFTGDWQDDAVWYIHCPSNRPSGGFLTIIKKQFCQTNNLAWRELVPGRLYLPHTNIDIVDAYQHVWGAQDASSRISRDAFGRNVIFC